MPFTVPVKVGFALGAISFKLRDFSCVAVGFAGPKYHISGLGVSNSLATSDALAFRLIAA